jgi:outer membrane beta-barrel protein
MNMNADLNLQVTRRSEKDMPMKINPNGHSGRSGGRLLGLLVALAVMVVPLAAQAQRKSPLADAPAVRKRFELRDVRLELGVGFGTTINQDYFHTAFFNLKAAFHITDWLAIGGFADIGVANFATTLQDNLINALPPDRNGTPAPPAFEPTKSEALASMQKIKGIYGLQLEFTPFTGKYSLFGKLFANYDFYVFGGGGLISVQPNDASNLQACGAPPPATSNGPFSCAVSGSKFGGTFGVGFHSYFNHWMALNVELRDMLAQLDPSGRDTNVDLHADQNDLTWTHTWLWAANLVFYLPATPSISP